VSSESSRFPNFLHNQLKDDSEVARITRRPPFTPRKIPGTHFCQRLSRLQGHGATGGIRLTEKSNDIIGNRTRAVAARNAVFRPTEPPCAPAE
jgi:hypothetical protein